MNATLSAVALSFALASTQPVLATEAVSASHLHLGHVMTQWHDTPEQQGLLTTAINEVKIAQVHAQAAAKQPDNLQWMQLHSTHVLHALDPSTMAKGPGLGYGLIKAVKGVTQHIKAVAKQGDASEALKLHSVHVATAASNALTWAEEALTLCRDIEKADTAQQAESLVQQLLELTKQIQMGTDANGDGAVTWHQGEGGLEASHKHARVIAKLDGVN